MIYLNNTEYAQVVTIPRSYPTDGTELTLCLKNTTGKTIMVDDVVDIRTSQLYFKLSFALPEDADPGEYEYTLMDGDIILSQGLAMVVAMDDITEYEKSIEYEQYED